ncbi:hypothetical protein VTH06DRAFT_6638 [Thermothelomyces fergusii]
MRKNFIGDAMRRHEQGVRLLGR